MRPSVLDIEYFLPGTILSNDALADTANGWSAEKIEAKTGIVERRVVASDECASDLAFEASKSLFAAGKVQPSEIDYLILCTQSPDYFLPTTACILQHRLGLRNDVGALDINLGCSGYIYGLGLATGLIESGQARRVLLVTAETYSKFIHPGDRSVRSLFGDGAAATLITASETGEIGPFIYGTDGSGAENLIVPIGGMRTPASAEPATLIQDGSGNTRTAANLYMNGPEIFAFTSRVVPKLVQQMLDRAGKTMDEIDLFVFHQANRYLLEHLRRKIGVPAEKFLISLECCGNTVSSTIPIAIKTASTCGRLKRGDLIMLVGFGVGYSWGATLLRW